MTTDWSFLMWMWGVSLWLGWVGIVLMRIEKHLAKSSLQGPPGPVGAQGCSGSDATVDMGVLRAIVAQEVRKQK